MVTISLICLRLRCCEPKNKFTPLPTNEFSDEEDYYEDNYIEEFSRPALPLKKASSQSRAASAAKQKSSEPSVRISREPKYSQDLDAKFTNGSKDKLIVKKYHDISDESSEEIP